MRGPTALPQRTLLRRLMLIAVPIVVALLSPVASGSAQVPASPTPMKIGIIGSGTMGGGLGLIWAAAGHEVLFSSRNPGELADLVARAGPRARAGLPEDAAAFGDVILLAVPSGALPQVGGDFAKLMQGKVVLEIGNPRADRDGPLTQQWLEMGTGQATAQYFPGVRLVKAFNALAAGMLTNGAHRPGERIGVPIAGDDVQALEVAARLVTDAGFDPVTVGPLARAREFDRGTPVWVSGMTAAQLKEALKLP